MWEEHEGDNQMGEYLVKIFICVEEINNKILYVMLKITYMLI